MRGSMLVLLSLVACDRTHMYPSYGQATRRALADQVINPKAGEVKKPDLGLDPEEAAIVGDTYRKGLAGKRGDGDKTADKRVLIFDPKGQSPNLPPSADIR